jgi:hypothetical protein
MLPYVNNKDLSRNRSETWKIRDIFYEILTEMKKGILLEIFLYKIIWKKLLTYLLDNS